ncbi:MAG: ATP-binding protein [Methylococcaceae bacterium]
MKDFCVACGDKITGNFIEINVADNGTGITPKIINKIFDPFFTTKEQGAGTGLGLSAVSGIVHHCSGHILIDSVQTEPNHGTTFRLLFPIPPQVLD